jgi:FKBP-type peptidyl-prolyl cis-trans isomerase (trigger factor)
LGDDDDELEFSDLFTDSQFTYDFADPDEDETFNDLFNNAEYAELFKGAALYSVIVKEYVIPDDVSSSYSSLAGHTIEITLTLDDCTYLPDWTDELVADYTSDTYTTVEDYKDYLVTSIIADLAFDAIVEATVVDTYPKKELKASYKSYVDQYVYQELGESVSNYTQSELDELISDDDYATIYAESAANAVTAVKQRLVLEYLISYYNITLTKSEYNEKLDEAYTSYAYYYYYYYGVSSADELETYYGKDYFELQFKSEKLNDYLSDYVTIVE